MASPFQMPSPPGGAQQTVPCGFCLRDRGLLLVNLGTPQSPAVQHVRAYLREFLMDGRVIDIPYPLRWLLVNGIIATFRAPASAEAYHKIWTDEGSPLLMHSRSLEKALAAKASFPVELAMRYGEPSIGGALRRLRDAGAKRVTVFPLFPHYAMSSYESAVEAVRRGAADLVLDIVPPFYIRRGYVNALVESARTFLSKSDHLVFSFHGIPERHLKKTDPTGRTCLRSTDCCGGVKVAHATCYRRQCIYTVNRFVQVAGLRPGSWSLAFQSRLGRDQWLKPASDQHLVELARSGVKRVAVICPSFVVDCLETLEEIGMRGRETFLNAGGEHFQLIPCLNTHPAWVEEAASICSL